MVEHETFWSLLCDPAHWCFELFLIAVFDGVIGLLLWPWVWRRLRHHESDDEKLEALWEEHQKRKQREQQALVSEEFKECNDCLDKPGIPPLCAPCLHNRGLIERLRAAYRATSVRATPH